MRGKTWLNASEKVRGMIFREASLYARGKLRGQIKRYRKMIGKT